MIKVIFKYIGYFLALAGAITIVWKVASAFERRSLKDTTTDQKLEIIIDNQHIQKTTIDSTLRILGITNSKLDEVIKSQNALQNSYVKHLMNDKTLTKDDFVNYMKDLEWSLKKNYENSIYPIVSKSSNYGILLNSK